MNQLVVLPRSQDHCGLQVEARPVGSHATQYDLAGCGPTGELGFDPGQLLRGVQRPEGCQRVQRVAQDGRAAALDEAGDDLIQQTFMDDEPAGRHALLASVVQAAGDDAVQPGKVSVPEDHNR